MGFKPKDMSVLGASDSDVVEFDEGKFLEEVVSNGYILAVGCEVLMNREIEASGDVKEYIRKCQSQLLKDDPDGRFMRMLNHGVDLTSWMLSNKDLFSYDIEDMDPDLVGLVRTKSFRFVLTTTFDGYLETLMRSVWGNEELTVVNIGDEDSLSEFRFGLLECQRQGKTYDRPTLVYLFGKALADESKRYVRTDDDAIRIIEKWIRMGDDDPVMRFLRGKRLLTLGCKFDDWYFRFFWYVLRRDKASVGGGEVAITLDTADRSERQLDDYLKRSHVRQHGDARLFMQRLCNLLTDDSGPLYDRILQVRRRGGVFISYCSRDRSVARSLFFAIRNRYDVWFDNASLSGGDNYNNEIADAIAQARVVITILSPTVADDLVAGRTENYYNQEWRMAAQLGNKTIIPLAVNGYNLSCDYHTSIYESVVGKPLSGIDLMQPDGMERLIAAIDKGVMNAAN